MFLPDTAAYLGGKQMVPPSTQTFKKKKKNMVWYPPRNLLGKLLGKPQREAKYDVIFVRILWVLGLEGRENLVHLQ